MPLTDSLPNGPASKTAGGSHCSGPVRTNVESGAGAAAGAAAAAGVEAACAVAGAAELDVCAAACPGAQTIVHNAKKTGRLWLVLLKINIVVSLFRNP